MNEQRQFCGSCGKPTPVDASFCPSCGSRLHAQTPLVSPQDIRSDQPDRTTSVFVLGLLSILTLAPLGIVGWLLSGKGTQQIKSGRAKPNSLFTAGKVMSIIGTTVTGLAIIISGIIFITSFLQRRTLYTTPGTETSLPIYPTNAAPSGSVSVQASQDLERVSIDGTWNIKGDGVDRNFHIVGYSNGDLNITDTRYTTGNFDWTITGQRQGERIRIAVTERPKRSVDPPDKLFYDLKLVSPTNLIGSVKYSEPTYGEGVDMAIIKGWRTYDVVVRGFK